MNIIGNILDQVESQWKQSSSRVAPVINWFSAQPLTLNDLKTQQQISSYLKTADLALKIICVITGACAVAFAASALTTTSAIALTFKLIFSVFNGVLCFDLWKCRSMTSRIGDVVQDLVKHSQAKTVYTPTDSQNWSKKFAKVRKDMKALILVGHLIDFAYAGLMSYLAPSNSQGGQNPFIPFST